MASLFIMDYVPGCILASQRKLLATYAAPVARSVACLAAMILLVLCSLPMPATGAELPPTLHGAQRVMIEVARATTPPLRDLARLNSSPRWLWQPRTIPLGRVPLLIAPEQFDPVLQRGRLPASATKQGLDFEGIGAGLPGFFVEGIPPDPNLSVGATQIVEWVNLSFAVFDKTTGALVMEPVEGNALWSALGGQCAADNDGDPIVKYDQLAGRWLMSQLAVTGGPPFYQCIAVSKTSDATGSYNVYAYRMPDFNDYPKVAVWPDAYYLSFNMFDALGNYLQPEACAMDRAAMLAGASAPIECFSPGSSYFGLLPSDLDGSTPPPTGSPDYFVSYDVNSLDLWRFHANFANPANATFSGPINIPVAPFTPACDGGHCIPQPDSSVRLDSLADRLMYRLAYRNFGDHESLVADHSIKVSKPVRVPSAVRWYEIRDPEGTPVLFQQGTYAPNERARWMGSVAMDKLGDLAVGYSESSATMHPSIAYASRLASDPLGGLRAETLAFRGRGSQLEKRRLCKKQCYRWGDYSAMAIDPADDCTFWYVNEYLARSGNYNWHTRIVSFKFPGCS